MHAHKRRTRACTQATIKEKERYVEILEHHQEQERARYEERMIKQEAELNRVRAECHEREAQLLQNLARAEERLRENETSAARVEVRLPT